MLAIYIRSLVLVCFAVLAMRLMGKRQVGQLQPFELVVAIMIADLASTPMESLDIPLWRGIIPLAATITLHQLFTLLSLKSQRMRAFFSGTPTVVIHRGKIDAKALERLCFNLNDLLEELRTCGILSPTDVGTAIMETSGKLSVFPRSDRRPLTPHDMGLKTHYEGIPLTLVMDGAKQSAAVRQGRGLAALPAQKAGLFGCTQGAFVLPGHRRADDRAWLWRKTARPRQCTEA